MMLQCLVENAIKHGLEPRPEGGELRITAKSEQGFLNLEVIYTGLGFGASPVVEMESVSRMLRNASASFWRPCPTPITAPREGGTCVTLRLPHSTL